MLFEIFNNNVFLISDTHFYHDKICVGSEVHFEKARNYANIYEMQEDIIHKWNSKVSNEDIVVFLGDFLMNCSVKETLTKFISIYEKLNGKRIYMVKGNHDAVLFKHIKKYIRSNPLDERFHRLILVDHALIFRYNNQDFVCQHRDFSKSEVGDQHILNNIAASGDFAVLDTPVYLHGHTHSDVKTSEFEYDGNVHIQHNLCWEARNDIVNVKEII